MISVSTWTRALAFAALAGNAALGGCGGTPRAGGSSAGEGVATSPMPTVDGNGNGVAETCAIVRVVRIAHHNLRFLAPGDDAERALWAAGHAAVIDAEVERSRPTSLARDEEVRASHILVGVAEDADASTRIAARARAEAILARALGGEPFAALARESTEDVSAFDGDLGWFRRGTMIPAFEEACFAVSAPALVPEVVQTQFGYHVILVSGHRAAGDLSAEDLRGDAIERLYEDEALSRGTAVLERALADVRAGRATLDAALDSVFGRLRDALTDVSSEPVLPQNGRLYFGPYGQRVEAAPIEAVHALAPGELLPALVPDDGAVIVVAGSERARLGEPACSITEHGDDDALVRTLRDATREN